MQLGFADLNFDVAFQSDGTLPSFRGTTLRGSFGFALKNLVCHISHRQCRQCILRSRCAYPVVFEGIPPDDRTFMRKYPNIPQPFVFTVDFPTPRAVKAGERFQFGIRLMGPAADLFPYVVYAVVNVGAAGLGRDRIPFDVLAVSDGHQTVYRRGDRGILTPQTQCSVAPTESHPATRLRLKFVTPFRFRVDGRLTGNLNPQDIFRATLRRFRILSNFYGDPEPPGDLSAIFAQAEETHIVESRLDWWETTRFSSRQQAEMNLGGIVGEWILDVPPGQLRQWFRVAEAIHLGKATSFGFGRIVCEELKE